MRPRSRLPLASSLPLASFAVALAACGGAARRPIDLTSEAERSGWKRTGRHAEAVRLCQDLAAAFPDRARCDRFGTTLEGRAMVALVLGDRGDPGGDRPRILIQGGIHAGEI